MLQLLTRHADYWSFKYLDFYESIGKVGCDSVKLYRDDCEIGKVVVKSLLNWEEVLIDYQKLLSFFPFKLSEKVFGSGTLG